VSRATITLDHSLAAGRARVARIMREDRRMDRRALARELLWNCGGLFVGLVVGCYCVAFFAGLN
jgi:hypothetical protein